MKIDWNITAWMCKVIKSCENVDQANNFYKFCIKKSEFIPSKKLAFVKNCFEDKKMELNDLKNNYIKP